MLRKLGVILFFLSTINALAGDFSDFKKSGIIDRARIQCLLQNGTFIEAQISSAFYQTMIQKVKFERSTFFRASFTGSTLSDSHFSDCIFERVDFEDATFRGVVTFQNIRSANFGEQFVGCTIFDQQGSSARRITAQDAMKLVPGQHSIFG